ncbi:MAG: pyridoxine/pyridoxal/pyridoxamine kinase [Candidatus Dechloromonas phosphoritropha]|jgi:pyridoxine kinase|nr:pyridoxine/pyridoxal/pyridoxamine kinase [Deltaproteobacteria bacterium]
MRPIEAATAVPIDPVPSLQPLPIDVVSVQSQVVYGRVGNNVAMPTLQAQGLIVAAVPTVILSNTPHYPTIHGGTLPTAWFEGYLRDLTARGALGRLRAILTGYLGSPEQAQALGRWIGQAIEAQPGLQVVVDPVLGDHDHGEYVSPGIADAYHRHLLPLADGLTPNGFELQRLTGLAATNPESVIAAARTLLVGRTQWVIVTSAAPAAWPANQMLVAVVTRNRQEVLNHPRIDALPKGTGDLFSAALTGTLLTGASVFKAASLACDQVTSALRLTRQAQCAELLLATSTGSSLESRT